MENCQQIAIEFAERNEIKFQILETSYGKHFATDKYSCHIFRCKLSHKRNSYTFNFGQSILKGSNEPSLYDILACLEKYGYNSFEDFCYEYGLDETKENKKQYLDVVKEFEGVVRVFSHCMDELCEIQ